MLISCVMATMKGRKHFLQKGIRYFQDQTYQNRELVIVDDDPEPLEDVPKDPKIKYLRVKPCDLGRKLNVGIEEARGDLIQKLDDDDYYAPRFLRAMFLGLGTIDPDNVIGSTNGCVMYVAETGDLRFSGYQWFLGSTLLFGRKVWERGPFSEDIKRSLDAEFIKRHPDVDKYYVSDPEAHMYVRHGIGHLWLEHQGMNFDDFLRTRDLWHRTIEEYVPEHADFYRSLTLEASRHRERP
jgi:glycosyltransferase involved in cell wall biosynthesis